MSVCCVPKEEGWVYDSQKQSVHTKLAAVIGKWNDCYVGVDFLDSNDV
jgi:hypothetical protein